MFQTGRSYKVKVETQAGHFGFGRATVLEKDPGKLAIRLATAAKENIILPKGTSIWFLGDSPGHAFSGLWRSTVTGVRTVSGRRVLECRKPRFEPVRAQRKMQRYPVNVAVRLTGSSGQELPLAARSRDISRSGIGIETEAHLGGKLNSGDLVKLVIETRLGDISILARIIRIDRNWLSRLTVIGLEFWEVSPQAADLVQRLLQNLSAREGGDADDPNRTVRGGLSSWMKASRDSLEIVRPLSEVEMPGNSQGSLPVESERDEVMDE